MRFATSQYSITNTRTAVSNDSILLGVIDDGGTVQLLMRVRSRRLPATAA